MKFRTPTANGDNSGYLKINPSDVDDQLEFTIYDGPFVAITTLNRDQVILLRLKLNAWLSGFGPKEEKEDV